MKAQDAISTIVTLTLLLSIFGLIGACKKWQYDECLSVGHSTVYCTAQVAGCLHSNSKR